MPENLPYLQPFAVWPPLLLHAPSCAWRSNRLLQTAGPAQASSSKGSLYFPGLGHWERLQVPSQSWQPCSTILPHWQVGLGSVRSTVQPHAVYFSLRSQTHMLAVGERAGYGDTGPAGAVAAKDELGWCVVQGIGTVKMQTRKQGFGSQLWLE